jgi:carboxyl-terminal processing protease
MPRELQRLIAILGMLAAFAVVKVPNSSFGQDKGLNTSSFAELMEQGINLEKDHRWQESIQHYEKVQRKFPQYQDTQRRLQIVRIHFDVTRRYSDKSFVMTLDQSQPVAALDLLGEILNKLQAYYVEPIDFSRLLRNGTAFLEVALTEKEFLETNVSPSVSPESIEYFRLNIHKAVQDQPITNVAQAKAMVSHVATLARDQIGVPPTAVIYEYISGFVGLLDPYSAYLTAGEYQEIMGQIEGNLIGLGVELWAEGNDLKIVEVFKEGPAFESGLRKGDQLIEIGGTRVDEVGAKRAADLLRGAENSVVRIVYRRDTSSTQTIEVRRRRVDVPSVSVACMVDPQVGTGYIRISNFQKTTPKEVDNSLRQLYSQGLRNLIIDLRRNPGGLLDASVEIADMFIASGIIVTTRGRNGQENHNYSAQMPGTWDVPMVVMIDEDSASASEIFAGAIRDQGRGLIVGRNSYGKGSVQGVFHNDQGNGGMRLTVSKFFSPSGTAISDRGIQPNMVFDLPPAVAQRSAAKIPVSLDPARDGKTAELQTTANTSDNSTPEWNQDIEVLRAIEVVRTDLPKLARRR